MANTPSRLGGGDKEIDRMYGVDHLLASTNAFY